MSTTRHPLETPTRFNGKCRCGAKHSRLVVAQISVWGGPQRGATRFEVEDGSVLDAPRDGTRAVLVDCACGKRLRLLPVLGKFRASKKCDARCLSATGHKCECSCGGRNHGAAHG